MTPKTFFTIYGLGFILLAIMFTLHNNTKALINADTCGVSDCAVTANVRPIVKPSNRTWAWDQSVSVMLYNTITQSTYFNDELAFKPSIDSHEPRCSGWVVGNNFTNKNISYIITAGHCLRHMVEIDNDTTNDSYTLYQHKWENIEFADGDIGTVTDQTLSKIYDIGMLTVQSSHPHQFALLDSHMVVSEPFIAVGFPNYNPWTFMPGITSSATVQPDSDYDNTVPVHCLTCEHGASGSGVMNYQGQIIGMTVMHDFNDSLHLTFIEPASHIIAFLRYCNCRN